MSAYFFNARQAQTSIPCKECGQPVIAARTCFRVSIKCPHCKKEFPLEDYLANIDDALEAFLDGVHLDRI